MAYNDEQAYHPHDETVLVGEGAPTDNGKTDPYIYLDKVTGTVYFRDSAFNWQQSAANPAGLARLEGPFPFSFDDADADEGIAFYTPTVGEILVDAWFEVSTAFDGTTPKADIGQFSGGDTEGYFGIAGDAVDLTADDEASASGGLVFNSGGGSLAAIAHSAGYRYVPGRFASADPLEYVLSQDGLPGGTAIDSTAGAGAIYLIVMAPRA